MLLYVNIYDDHSGLSIGEWHGNSNTHGKPYILNEEIDLVKPSKLYVLNTSSYIEALSIIKDHNLGDLDKGEIK